MPQPVQWTGGQKAIVTQWLADELTTALRERLPLEAQWRAWLDQYNAPAKQPLKDFPFVGAFNYMLPVTATDVDQMFAMLMQTLHAAPNLWTLTPQNERWVKCAKPMQDLLEATDHRLLKMFQVNTRTLLETTKLGTGIYKTGWLYERRPIQTYDINGKRVKQDLVRTQPFVDQVRLSDFILPTYAYAIQPDAQGGAPWVAERMRLRRWQFDQMARKQGDFLPAFGEKEAALVVQFEEQGGTPQDQHTQQNQYSPGNANNGGTDLATWSKEAVSNATATSGGASRVREIEIYEIHARVPTSPDQLNDVILWFHLPTQTILRAVYADWLGNERPYDKVVYMPTEGFYGIGMCQQKEMFQQAGSEIINFELNNMVIGNSTMIAARAGANIAPNEPIYPGKQWITEGNPRDEIMGLQFGQLNPGIMQTFGVFQSLGERRTGVSDIQLGQIGDLPGRTPATTMLSLLQEGKRRPDLTIKGFRYDGLSAVGLKVLQSLQQQIAQPTSEAGPVWLKWAVDLMGMPEGSDVAEKLVTPAENVAFGIGVSLTATSGTANKEAEKQSLQQLMTTVTAAATQIIQFQQLAMMGGPVGGTALAAANGLTELTRRLLQQYDERDIEAIIPSAPVQPLPLPPAPLGAAPGAPGAPTGPDGGGSQQLASPSPVAPMGNLAGGLQPAMGV